MTAAPDPGRPAAGPDSELDPQLARLFAVAREDRPAPLDVTDQVSARLAALPAPAHLDGPARHGVSGPLWTAAGLSLAAAALVAVLAAPYLDALLDPMLGLLGAEQAWAEALLP